MSDHDIHYPPEFIAKLEMLWGDGFLSPGGPAEVAEILTGLDLSGQHVLDIGCGVGGIDVLLAETYGAETVVGIDVEDPVLDRARERVAERGLQDRITFQRVEPGPLPFEEASFDAVFTKDAMIHIPDKQALYADVLRILRPGGLFVGSDWLKGFSRPYSDTMKAWIKGVGLQFEMASVEETHQALEAAGFVGVEVRSRNDWYREEGRNELRRIGGELRESAIDLLGADGHENWVTTRENMIKVLDAGEFCPSHIRARRAG
ncbi:MAG: methyltransferase domain-containing protein [Hyphomicrobiales bacterium]